METIKRSLSVFIDESGSITKTNVSHNKYFIIALLFTQNSQKINRYFKKGIAKLMKVKKYKDSFVKNGEIKGNEVPESKKKDIYDRIIRHCKNDFEIGIIVLENNYTTDKFIQNHARAFNFLIQKYMDNMFRNLSKYRENISNIHLIVDNQNIATDAKYTLDGYLNQHLTIVDPLCDHFHVDYTDSKQSPMVQFIDFISNSFYRNIEKRDRESIVNIKLLMDYLCGQRFIDFSVNKDTSLLLDA
jgi:hypothetical protein